MTSTSYGQSSHLEAQMWWFAGVVKWPSGNCQWASASSRLVTIKGNGFGIKHEQITEDLALVIVAISIICAIEWTLHLPSLFIVVAFVHNNSKSKRNYMNPIPCLQPPGMSPMWCTLHIVSFLFGLYRTCQTIPNLLNQSLHRHLLVQVELLVIFTQFWTYRLHFVSCRSSLTENRRPLIT